MFAASVTPSRQRGFAAALVRGAWAAAISVKRAVVAYQNRRIAYSMLDLDDRMLRDIGLTRGDIHAAVADRPTDDPTVRLRILAVERRAASRAAAAERLAFAQALRAESAAVPATPLRLVHDDRRTTSAL